MTTGYFKKFGTTFLLTPALLLATLPASAQSYGRDDGHNRDQRTQQVQRHDNDRDSRGRDYQARDVDRDRGTGYVTYAPAYRGDYGYYAQDNGIGPGKGAAIGAVSGAVLGALFGGGKGAIIGGAAGAGVGAVAGQAAQDHRYSRY
jgi:hypothetical protein